MTASPFIPKSVPADSGFLLVAEDNPADVGLIRLALKTHEVSSSIHLVADGEEALRFIEQLEEDRAAPCPLLAIVDLNLPRVSGNEILKRVRASSRWHAVPVIVMSSSLSGRDRAEAMRLGASRYFAKPSELEQFLELGALVKDMVGSSDDAPVSCPETGP